MKTKLQLPLFTLMLTMLCLGLSSGVLAQGPPPPSTNLLVDYPFTGNSPVPTQLFAGLSATNFTVSTGSLTYGTAQPTTWTGSGVPYAQGNGGWGQSTQEQGKFFTFTLQTESAIAFDIDAISFLYRSTTAGPETITITINDVEVDVITGANTNSTNPFYFEFGFIYEDLKDITSAEVKIIGWNGGGGEFRIDDVQLYGSVVAGSNPLLFVNPTEITNLDYTEGFGPSDSQSFDVSGINLEPVTGNITVTAPANFEVSEDDINFSSSLNLPYTGGEHTATTVYVRLQADLGINTYNGDIIISGGDADDVEIAVSGEVTEFSNICLEEDFEGTNPPAGWTMNSISYGGQNCGGGNIGMVFNSVDDYAITPPLITPQTLNFSKRRSGNTTAWAMEVQIANSVSGPWTTVDTISDITNTCEEEEIDLTTHTTIPGTYYIRFLDTRPTGGTHERTLDNIVVTCASLPTADFVYQNGVWTPSNPNDDAVPTDDILIVNGTATFTNDIEVNNIIVNTGATLEIQQVLKSNGNIANHGSIVFKSTSIDDTAQLDTFTGTITGSGEVTVERFIPARRAFRLLSSAVTTPNSINANWQEGVNNPDTSTNLDPSPGFGTHITGSVMGDNGFDATPSGNPSLFTLNNAAQSWEAVANTDVNTITAGTPYRLMVRGDRSIDVTDNNATPTNTVLRTTGALHTGTFATTDFSENEGAFNFLGNPYPAVVDMNAVLSIATNTNVNPNSYYIWDPHMNTRGAYVAVDLDPEVPNPDQYLQPGQAAFVTTLVDGEASLTFLESHKSVTQPLTQVFSVVSKIDLRLFTASAFAQSESAADGLRIKFSEEYTNAITPLDAAKFYNLDENLATDNNGSLLSIESRALPQVGETIPLFTNQYRTTDYVFEADLTEINDITALLLDNFTGTTTQLENNENTLYAFTINPNNPESIATDRFEIIFQELLSTNDQSFGNGFVLFPNPAQGEINIATRGISGHEVQLTITGVLGQNVYSNLQTVNANGLLTIDTTPMAGGVYILKLTGNNGQQFTTKFIKK